MSNYISDLSSPDSIFWLWFCHTSFLAIAQIFYNMLSWDLLPAIPTADDALPQIRVWLTLPFSVHYLNATFSVRASWTDLFKIISPTEATNWIFPSLLSDFFYVYHSSTLTIIYILFIYSFIFYHWHISSTVYHCLLAYNQYLD